MAKIGSDARHATEAVRETARLREPDRYLAALLAPRSVREDLVALAAFSAELLRVHDIVRDPMMGEIRLQWWRDALQVLARGERTANPIADALGAAMLRHNLAPALLEIPIEARSRELQAATDIGGEGTAVEAEAALFSAALLVLDVPVTPASDVACASAGVAYGIARGLVITSTRQGTRGATPAQGDQAREALVSARRQIAELGLSALVAFLPLVMVEPYLRALEQRDADRHEHFAYITPLRRVWRIWRAKRRRRL
jgi:15-cis-phytoene synthase